jgi:tetratricopeptide (TPR) repeat protein
VLAATGQNSEAEQAYERRIELQPSSSRYVLLAGVKLSLGNDSAAEAALRHTLTLESDNEEALLNLALHIRGDRPKEALELLQRAAEIDPLNAAIARELGFELAKAERFDEAQHFLETALALNRSDSWTHLYLAKLYDVQGRTPEAQAAYLEAIRAAPLSALLRQQLARFYDEHGKPTESIENLRAAVELEPTDSEGAFLLGNHLIQAGYRDDGIQWIEKALKLDPGHQAARALRERLLTGDS